MLALPNPFMSSLPDSIESGNSAPVVDLQARRAPFCNEHRFELDVKEFEAAIRDDR